MNFSFDDLSKARDAGYTDEQILNVLSNQEPQVIDAHKSGYSLDQITSVLTNTPIPQEPEPEPSGVLRQAADIPIKVAEGAIGSVKSFADLFGADNAVSKELAGYEEWVGGLVSAESKQDSKEIARILKDAEDKGVYDKVIAGLEAFSKAPLEMSAQSVGYMVPQLAAGVLGKAAQFTKAGIIGAQLAIGFAQGVGTIKGDIYDATTDYLREKGMPEDQIEPIASKAQSYGGGNLDQMLIGGGLMAVDALGGSEAILTRVLTKQGKPVSEGIIKSILKKGVEEAAIEIPQEGQEQVAQNLALQREGYDVPTFQGAVSRAAMAGAAGFAMGGSLGGLEAMSPEKKAEKDINEAADKAARDLETPSGNPAAMALSTEITRNQDAIENLRSDLDAMEPNDPRAQKLRFDISDRQKTLTDLQLQYQKITGNDQEIPAVSIAASRRMEIDNKIETLSEEIGMDEEALATMAEGSQERIDAQAVLDKKKTDLATATKEIEGLSLTIKPPVEAIAEAATPSTTIEEAKTKIEELNTEFDALDENDKAGIDRVNTQIFAEQNKIAELTAIEQGIEPQGTTPTREMGLPPSGRTTTPTRPRMLAGEFYADRPILKAFMSATDKVVGRIPVFSKRAQKLKNAIRTGIANNAGFLAGTNTKVITSEEFGKLTGRKQVAADTGTYKAVFVKGQKYLVVPDINQLAGISIRGEQTSTSRDAAIDQESRAAAKKLEEEMLHLSVFQILQDEYKSLKKPKLTEQKHIEKRLLDIAKEINRTNPNALPRVSNAYLNDKTKLLDDLTFSQEFLRIVAQRIRTGQITEDLNAIRKAEQEAFSDQDKGIIKAWKNSILNALQLLRNSIARYLGKGTSTREVEKMLNAMNTILDEYGIVKGEANYEFKDYSAAQPKGELKAEPIEEATTAVETSTTDRITDKELLAPIAMMEGQSIEARAGATPTQQYSQTFELFNKYTEPMGRQPIKVEATSIDEASKLIKSTEEYKRIKSRYAKVFAQGDPIVVPRPGESPIIARAGVTPQPSARSVKIEKKITQQIINDIEGLINDLKPMEDKSGRPYVSRTTLKGKTYAKSLVSPFSKAVNLYTMTGHESALSAFNKVLKGNPDASFFDIASNLTLRDENGEPVVTYGLSKEELPNLIHLLNIVAPTYRQMVMDSDASFEERSRIALSMPAIEFGLTKAVVKIMQAAGRTLNLAKTLRQMGGYGMAVANYKSNVQKSIGNLWSKIGGDMNDIASYARGDRRKSVDSVASLSKVISKLVSLQKMAIKNPEKARDSIRKAISGKQTEATKKILLAFSASTFDDKTEKFANMIIDETAKAILSIGTKKGSSNTDSTYKKIYKAISSVAKQTAQEEEKKKQEAEGQPKAKKQAAKREGKFLEQVGMVIGNDKTYKQFMDEVRKSIRQEYQSDAEFNAEYKDLFDKLSNREWSESMRQQAIKDSADALDYKFAELFQYIGSQRNATQESVKTHIRFELQSMGATAEMVDKFTADVDNYLNEETRKVLEKKLGFVVDKETGKITGGQIIKDKMKELSTTEGQFKLAKTLKGLTRLAASDQRNFIDKLNELIITELGFDDTASSELSKIIEGEITKAVTAQQSENLKQAIDRVTKTLEDNNIKAKGTQRTILKRIIELANMGQLDDMKVYEAFRQTHNFDKGYLEYSPDMVQTLREWGDRISALPEGVLRGIEEQKMGRYMLEKGVFTTTDYLSSYWYFSLLSQTGTQAMNVLGSSFNLIGNIATWGLYTKGKSIGPMMRGLARAISGKQSPAANSFLYVMQTGLNPSGLQDEKMMIYPKGNLFENATPENVPKLVYNLITFGADRVQTPALNALLNTMSPRGMMRMMRATDAYMREVAYEVRAASLGAEKFSQEQYDAAFRQAEVELQASKSSAKEKKKEIIIRANEILADKRLKAKKREFAEQDSLEVMYSQKPEGLVGLIASFANKMLDAYPVTRLFIPFTNVCANVLNENLNYAPLVSQFRLMRAVELSPLLKGKIKLRPGTEKNPFIKGREEKAADLAIKSAIGLAASAVPFIIAAIAGGDDEDQDKERPFVQFYSQGPKDPEQNKIWSENGGTKYSIRFGNTYVSYLFTPLVIPLSWGQMMKEEADAFKKKTGEKGIGDVSEAVFKLLASPVSIGFVAALDQSFLTGISDLIELKEARDLPKAGAGIARNIISRMLVPGVARDIQKLMVDERLEGDLYITNMLKEFPGSSAFLDKDLNYFGDPARYNSIMQENGFTRRAFSLVGRITSTEKPDQAFEILYRNGITPPNWSQSMSWRDKTPMTKAEQREFIASAGPSMKEFIIRNEEILNQMDTETAQKYVVNSFSAIRGNAKRVMQIKKL